MRNALEFVIIILIAVATLSLEGHDWLPLFALKSLIILICWGKTLFFVTEEILQLSDATRVNMPYHQFMRMMLVNMFQMVVSFALDFYCLLAIDPSSFSLNLELEGAELLFECVYFSTLNFTFFGYGDITPQTVPAKLLTMTEISLAFLTVIFLLSDFISLKESLRMKEPDPGEPHA